MTWPENGVTRECPGQLGFEGEGEPGKPGSGQEERAGGGGSGNWEWPGFEGGGRPRAAGVRCDRSEPSRASRNDREGAGDLLRKAAVGGRKAPGELRGCGS